MKKEVLEKFNQQDLECFNQITNILKSNGYSISVSLTNDWHSYKSINETHEWSAWNAGITIYSQNINGCGDFSKSKCFYTEKFKHFIYAFNKWIMQSGTNEDDDVTKFIETKIIEQLKKVLSDYYEMTVGQVQIRYLPNSMLYNETLHYKGFHAETSVKDKELVTTIFSNIATDKPFTFKHRALEPRQFKNMIDELGTLQNIKERYAEFLIMNLEPCFHNKVISFEKDPL